MCLKHKTGKNTESTVQLSSFTFLYNIADLVNAKSGQEQLLDNEPEHELKFSPKSSALLSYTWQTDRLQKQIVKTFYKLALH